MKLNALSFSETKDYKVAILVKDQSFRRQEIEQHYVKPLLARGFSSEEIVALNLIYNDQGKAPVKLIKEHLEGIKNFLDYHGIKHILCADASYFKVLCKLRKAEPYYGYSMPSIWPGVQAALTVNYMQLFYQPQLKTRMDLGIKALCKEYFGGNSIFNQTIFGDVKFPETGEQIAQVLKDFLSYPALTVDIETFGLELHNSSIGSIAIGTDQHSGAAFLVEFSDERYQIKNLLRQFFYDYKGKLIFHGGSFDTKMLTYQLFMSNNEDYIGMLQGLELLHKDIEDTLILTYLATNSAAGNELSLKYQSFEFTGNYALEEIKDITKANVNDLLVYNLTDALATWYVYNKYREEVKNTQEDIYQNLYKPFLKTIAQTELIGLPFCMSQVRNTNTELNQISVLHNNSILAHPIIKVFTNTLKLEKVLSANEKLKVKRKTKSDFDNLEFNPGSPVQLRKLLYEHLQLPVQSWTDTKLPSTDGKAIDGLIAYLKKKYDL